jgi:hypothetical protein
LYKIEAYVQGRRKTNGKHCRSAYNRGGEADVTMNKAFLGSYAQQISKSRICRIREKLQTRGINVEPMLFYAVAKQVKKKVYIG